jgi:hypothetical protein
VITISLLKKFSIIFQYCKGTFLLSTFQNGAEFTHLDLSNQNVIFKQNESLLRNFEVCSIHHVIENFLLFIQLDSSPPSFTRNPNNHFKNGFFRNPSFEYESYFQNKDTKLNSKYSLEELANIDFKKFHKFQEENLSDSFLFQLGQQLYLLIIFTSEKVELILRVHPPKLKLLICHQIGLMGVMPLLSHLLLQIQILL